MRLRLVQFLRGKSLIKLFCALAVAAASILHVDVSIASTPANGIAVADFQEDGQGAADQGIAERCHLCAVSSFANAETAAVQEVGRPAVPSSRSDNLVAFKPSATAPPPRS